MPANGRKFVRVVKFLLAGVTVFCVSWIASVGEWHTGVRWTNRQAALVHSMPTMRTIVAYSAGKQAEMDRPMPVTCDRLPVFPQLINFNRSWSHNSSEQKWQRVAGTRVSLYAAYYDERTPQRYVRILAMFSGRNFSSEESLYCQTRSLNPYNDSVEVVAAKPLEMWWRGWDATHTQVETPLLLSCPLTDPLNGPSVVSVVTQPCDDPTNAFQLKPSQQERERMFTICVKDLKFQEDISQSLIEWIETNKILGADIIDMYVDDVTKATEKVLLHYQDEGYIRLFHVPIKHKSNRSLWQRRRDHIITYNDCLYRNLKQSEFVIPLDVDEIILPKIAETWPELLIRLESHGWNASEYSSVIIRNVFFFNFMQGVDKYKVVKPLGVENKIYIKRDDVRINPSANLEIGKIELIDSNLNNEVIDKDKEVDEMLKEKYKDRCGRAMPAPKVLSHVVSSAATSPVGDYSKSWMVTKKVLTAFNHYPLTSLGASGFAAWSPPFKEVQLNHYKESCNTTVFGECAWYGRRARVDTAALRLRRRLTRALASAICTPINHI